MIGIVTVAYISSYATYVYQHTHNGKSPCVRKTVRREPVTESNANRVTDDYFYISTSEMAGKKRRRYTRRPLLVQRVVIACFM